MPSLARSAFAFAALLLLLLLAPTATGLIPGAVVTLDESLTALAMADRGSQVVAGGDGGGLWYYNQPGSLGWNANHTGGVIAVAVSQLGERVLAGDESGTVVLYDGSGTVVSEHLFEDELPVAVAMTSAGDYYAVAYDSGVVRFWRAPASEPQWQFSAADLGGDTLLALTSDYVAVAGDTNIYLLRRAKGGVKWSEEPSMGSPLKLVIAPGGFIGLATERSLFLYGPDDGLAWRYDVTDWRNNSVIDLAIDPTGERLVLLHAIEGSQRSALTAFAVDLKATASTPLWSYSAAQPLTAVIVTTTHVAAVGFGLGEENLVVLSRGGARVDGLQDANPHDHPHERLAGAGRSLVVGEPQALRAYTIPAPEDDAFSLGLPFNPLYLLGLLVLAGAVFGGVLLFQRLDLGGGVMLPPAVPGPPGAGLPGLAQPGAAQPVKVQPLAGPPGAGLPGLAQPGVAQPVKVQPLAGPPAAPPVKVQPLADSPAVPVKVQPVVAQPAAPQAMATIECPQCSERMAVPRLGREQEVTCPACRLSGVIEI